MGLLDLVVHFFEKYLEFINSECVTAIYKQGCNTLFIVGWARCCNWTIFNFQESSQLNVVSSFLKSWPWNKLPKFLVLGLHGIWDT
jgi:hypothetical protein